MGSDGFSLAPRQTGVSRVVKHAPFSDDPAISWAGEANFQQIREPRTRLSTGQGMINPRGSAVYRLKECSCITHRPAGSRIGKHYIEQGHGMLCFMWRPGDPAVVGRQDSPECTNDRPGPVATEMRGIERGCRAARLLHPVITSIGRMKNRTASADHPSNRWRGEIDAVQRLLRIEGL